MNRLLNKVALITGAAGGIGTAIARAFAAEGAFVVVTDINREGGAALGKELGERAVFRYLDVREENQWSQLTAEVLEQRHHLDVVVNLAGVTGFEGGMVAHDPEHVLLEDWREVHRTNLDGVLLGCKYAIRAMRKTCSGSIINMSSRSGLVGVPSAAAYASSKAGVRNHTKSVALYCAEQGLNIRCNSLHPAAILTSMWDPMLGTGADRPTRMKAFVKDTPLRRFGRPDEVAALAVLLASDEAAYMTGTELTIDGGILAGSAASPERQE